VIRHRFDADVLEHDHRAPALHNAEEDVVRFGPFKCDLKPELIALEGKRLRNIPHDKQGRSAADL